MYIHVYIYMYIYVYIYIYNIWKSSLFPCGFHRFLLTAATRCLIHVISVSFGWGRRREQDRGREQCREQKRNTGINGKVGDGDGNESGGEKELQWHGVGVGIAGENGNERGVRGGWRGRSPAAHGQPTGSARGQLARRVIITTCNNLAHVVNFANIGADFSSSSHV